MGIKTEKERWAVCDNPECGSFETEGYMSIKDFKELKRKQGWKVTSKEVLCPKCYKKKLTGGKVNE